MNKYIRITDIDEGTYTYKYDDVVSPNAQLENKYKVQKNDILFARTGASTGKAYLYNEKDGLMYYAGFLIRGNVKPAYNAKFVFLQTQTQKYKKWVDIMSIRSGQPGINSQEYSIFKFHLPPSKAEQDKISTLFSLLDERIATQIRIIDKLQSLMKGITNRIIEDLISNAESVPFSEIYQMAGEGGTPDTTKTQYYEEGTIPFIKIDDLSSKYLTKNKDFITEQGLQKSSAWIIPENSLIYSNGATIGAASINTYKVATKQGILGIVPKSMISVEYLFYLVTSTFFDSQVHRIITHGTMATAYLKDINNIKVPLPCMNEQRRIVTGLASLSDKIEIEQGILFNLQKQKRFLLCKLFI